LNNNINTERNNSDSEIHSLFTQWKHNKTLQAGEINRLRAIAADSIEQNKYKLSNHLIDIIIRLFDYNDCNTDIDHFGQILIKKNSLPPESLNRYLNNHLELKGSFSTISLINELSIRLKQDSVIQTVLAKCYYKQGEYKKVINIYSEWCSPKQPPTEFKSYYIASLVELHEFKLIEDYLNEKTIGRTTIPEWVVNKIFYTLLQLGKNELFRRFKSILFNDSPIDELLLDVIREEVSGDFDKAEELINNNISKYNNDDRLKIALSNITYKSYKWLENESLFHEVLAMNKIGKVLRDNLNSALECISKLRSNWIPPTVNSKNLELKLPDSIYEYVLQSDLSSNYQGVKNKIVHVGATLGPGGAERVLAQTFLGQKQYKDYKVGLWLYSDDPEKMHDFYIKELGIRRSDITVLDEVSIIPVPFKWLPNYHAINSYKIYLKILEDKPDIIHGWQDSVNIDLCFAAAYAGVNKIVLHSHNMRPTLVHYIPFIESFKRIYLSALSRSNIRLICVSNAAKQDYLEWIGLEKSKNLVVLYNGFELPVLNRGQKERIKNNLLEEYGIAKDKFVVGTAIRFTDVKRPLLWIEIASRVLNKDKDVHFVLFGDGELLDECKSKVNDMGIAPYFTFTGRVSNVPEKIAMLDLFLLTSKSEGLPTAVIEAQFARVPVISSDVGGVSECFLNGVTGFLVHEDSEDSYVNKILRVKSNHSMLSETDVNVAEFVRNRFSANSMQTKLFRIYDQV